MPNFDDIFMELAARVATKSHCVKQQVGAVVAKDTRVISIGYNGPPAGTYNCDEQWPDTGCPRSLGGGCSLALHAEQNALLYAAKNKVGLEGATVYVTLAPCLSCARVMITLGIKKVFYTHSYAAYKGLEREEGIEFLQAFGVAVMRYQSAPASPAQLS